MVREATKSVLLITGMLNNRDRERVADALERVAGVLQVDVSLHRAEATVLHNPARIAAGLAPAVAGAGYHATIVQNGAEAAFPLRARRRTRHV